MVLINEKVTHKTFGSGQVSNQEPNLLYVEFPVHGVKKFAYPDCFENFLVVCNPTIEPTILKELTRRKELIKADKAIKKEALMAELQLVAKEKTLQKKKAAPKASAKKK